MNTSVTSLEPGHPRTWQRYSGGQKALRFMLYLLLVAAIVQAVRSVEVIPEFLYDAPEQMAALLRRMWPIDWSYYPEGVHAALVETLHIATLGTILSVGMAVPVGLLAANNLTPSRTINMLARLILVSSRSVNSLVWALLFIAIFGPGALAGTLAIAFRSIGFVGKLVGEAIEEAQRGPIEALTATGASKAAVLWYGYWPQIRPSFWSIVLLRWDINVRESAVLGLVGAGGIGMALDTALNLFQWDRVALVLAAIFIVVVAAEIVITQARKRIRLHAMYFDTPGRELARARIAIRLRQEGRDWVQTLKMPGANAISRVEINHPRPGPVLDLSVYAGTEAQAALTAIKGELGLRYETDVQRLFCKVRGRHGTVELAYDTGVLRAGALELPISELEFELVSGRPAAIFAMARS